MRRSFSGSRPFGGMLAVVLAVGSSVRILNTPSARLDFVTGTPPRNEGARERSVEEIDRHRIVEHPAFRTVVMGPAIRAAVLVEPSRYFGVALAETRRAEHRS